MKSLSVSTTASDERGNVDLELARKYLLPSFWLIGDARPKLSRWSPKDDRHLGLKVKEMKLPNSRERQITQHLRGAGWVKATGLPDSPKIIANLIRKGWVECQQTENGSAYRLTNLGLEAKKAPLPVRS
jgi:hypothetical protein